MADHEIIHLSTAELTPYLNNSRTHSDGQISQIASSITEFGFTNPILIDKDNSIIAGHGRVQAAKKLGLDRVPCITLHNLTDAQKKAYVIADNQLALNAGWDIDMLTSELDHLKSIDFDIDLLGFDAGFMEGLLGPDFSDKNREIDVNEFEDLMELKFRFSSDQYEAVRAKLARFGDSPEIALLQALGL